MIGNLTETEWEELRRLLAKAIKLKEPFPEDPLANMLAFLVPCRDEQKAQGILAVLGRMGVEYIDNPRRNLLSDNVEPADVIAMIAMLTQYEIHEDSLQ